MHTSKPTTHHEKVTRHTFPSEIGSVRNDIAWNSGRDGSPFKSIYPVERTAKYISHFSTGFRKTFVFRASSAPTAAAGRPDASHVRLMRYSCRVRVTFSLGMCTRRRRLPSKRIMCSRMTPGAGPRSRVKPRQIPKTLTSFETRRHRRCVRDEKSRTRHT